MFICWDRRFELHHVAHLLRYANHYTKSRFLQEYDFTDNHELYWCPVFVSHGLQPMLNDLQREPWPVNHLPAGNIFHRLNITVLEAPRFF